MPELSLRLEEGNEEGDGPLEAKITREYQLGYSNGIFAESSPRELGVVSNFVEV